MNREQLGVKLYNYWPLKDLNEYDHICPICYCIINTYQVQNHIQYHLDLFDLIHEKKNDKL